MKIFISYRRKDSGREIGRIRDRLKQEFGEDSVFRDLVDIHGGVDFREVLHRETHGCTIMLVIIGPDWASITNVKTGQKRLFEEMDYTRIEVETGLKRLAEGTIAVFPVLVQEATMPSPAELPPSICDLANQNAISIHDDPYFDFDMNRLIQDINALNFEIYDRKPFEPETIYVPEGRFLMGSPEGKGFPAYESPQSTVDLPAYWIGKFPVTNLQFQEFVKETLFNTTNLGWEGKTAPKGKENHPINRVTWSEALAYCNWLSEKTKRSYSLPTESQWEKACCGGNHSLYPWGEEFDSARCNHGNSNIAAVDAYPMQSVYGYDFVGNIRQWTRTLWGEDPAKPEFTYSEPWNDDDGRNELSATSEIRRVVRGAALEDDRSLLRCSARLSQAPTDRSFAGHRCGFRVVMTKNKR